MDAPTQVNFFSRYHIYLRKLFMMIVFIIPTSAFATLDHPRIDSVLIDKSERKMYLISNGTKYREFIVSLGANSVGHKQKEGDKRTPEGNYKIDFRNGKSRYHLSLHITYPNSTDKNAANDMGVKPGGDIFIHGLPNLFACVIRMVIQLDISQ